MSPYRAHGKLLLTAEYAITQGAQGLAVPTVFGQNLIVEDNVDGPYIEWVAKDREGRIWLEASFDKALDIIATNQSAQAEWLRALLLEAQSHAPKPLPQGRWTTQLDYPQSWGLGSSSALTSLIAQAAQVPGHLLRAIHKGSGYDIACATAEGPILYTLTPDGPKVARAPLQWQFTDDLALVYSGKKQLTDESLSLLKKRPFTSGQIEEFTQLTQAILAASSISDLEKLIQDHEARLAQHLGLPRVQEVLFKTCPGIAKSLGGWGGDFVLLTQFHKSKSWLKANGFEVVFPFDELVLHGE